MGYRAVRVERISECAVEHAVLRVETARLGFNRGRISLDIHPDAYRLFLAPIIVCKPVPVAVSGLGRFRGGVESRGRAFERTLLRLPYPLLNAILRHGPIVR